jgi:hypothetical protein
VRSSGDRLNSVSQFSGQPAILAVTAPGFAVRSLQADNTAAAALQSFTALVICSHAAAVTDWLTPASKRAHKIGALAAHETSGSSLVAALTYFRLFRKSREECTSAPICAFGHAIHLHH